MKLKFCFGVTAAALMAAALPGVAHAAVIAGSMQESFSDYTAGTTFTNITPPSTVQNGGLGWNTTGTTAANDTGASWGAVLNAGSARSITSPGLTYSATGYLAPTGNKLTLDGSGAGATENIGRTLGGQTIDSGTMYFSFLMSKANDTQRTLNLAFEQGTTEHLTIGQIGAAAGGTGGNIGLLMNNTNPAGIVTASSPIAMGVNTTHLIIGRVDFNTNATLDTVTLWVDPTDVTTEAGATQYLTTSAFDIVSFNEIRPFAGNNVATPAIAAVTGSFDEIRIGGTWNSVTTDALPEPASVGLLGLGLIGLMKIRRR